MLKRVRNHERGVLSDPPLIQVESLLVRYGQQIAVDSLSFELPAGQILALLGPNGAGKTSAFRCLAGIQEATEGKLSIAGFDLKKEPLQAKKHLSYVPEQACLYEALTPMETMLLKGRLHGLQDSLIAARGTHLLEMFGIAERMHDPVAGFSKGMRQKLVLSLALLNDPKVLILDEPLSGLDVDTALLVKELLKLLTKKGKAILYCSHVLDVVEKVADRILILLDGRTVAMGSMEELSRENFNDAGLEAIFRDLTSKEDPVDRARRLLDWPS